MKKIRIGYTTGTFDLFHIGHLNILRKSKELCDYLVVGVSTDECVESYKNKTPVIPFDQRIAIVSAIKYVDKVVPQKTMDKFAAWEQIKYDVMFHGDDWKGSDMYNDYEMRLKEVGVEIIYLPHTDGISSTIIKEKTEKNK